jgi:phosphoglycolate phosphatase
VKIPAFPVYLFDVDGTLTDSAQDICAAVRSVVNKQGYFPTEEFMRGYIGRHLDDLFLDLNPAFTKDELAGMLADYRAVYHGFHHGNTRVYPGVSEALSRLGGRKSTATTKGTPTTRIVLELFGLLPYFDHVQGTDGFPAKPRPDVIQKSLDVFAATPAECLMVGDSPADMEAGRNAGVKICAVRYGYGNVEQMAVFEPDYWIDDLRELLPV